jgi:hypothetical protein
LSATFHADNQPAAILALLEDEIDLATFESAMEELVDYLTALHTLRAVQFVKDAMQGNLCPDRQYTARIMKFIAAAEAAGVADNES